MKARNKHASSGDQEKFNTSLPVRLTPKQQDKIDALTKTTGLNRSVIMRLGYAYFVDQVEKGQVDVFDLLKKQAKAA